MVGLGTYRFKDLNKRGIKTKPLFKNAYVEELYGSEHVSTSTKILCVILYAKYENSYLHKVMETQCQHLTVTQRNELLELLHKFEELFNGTLVTWKIYPVDVELKKYAKPICSQPYPVSKVHEEMLKKEVEYLVLLG